MGGIPDASSDTSMMHGDRKYGKLKASIAAAVVPAVKSSEAAVQSRGIGRLFFWLEA